MKEKVNFQLLNILIILGIFTLIFLTADFWFSISSTAFQIVTPFLIAFAIAYSLFPLLQWFTRKGIPKPIGVLMIALLMVGLFGGIILSIFPLLFEQTGSLFESIMAFLEDIGANYNIDIGSIEESLKTYFDSIITDLGQYVADGAVTLINASIGVMTTALIIFILSIYLLIDMKKMRTKLKKVMRKRNKQTFKYLEKLDSEMGHYLEGMLKYIGIQIVEYTLAFWLIGHPNFLLLGILSGITAIIPYFGGMAISLIAVITASVVSTQLFVLTIIVALILPNVDGYIISPRIFNKSNNINPLLSIFAVFAGGIIAGVPGIIVAIPLTIVVITTLKYYESDIADLVTDMKDRKEKID